MKGFDSSSGIVILLGKVGLKPTGQFLDQLLQLTPLADHRADMQEITDGLVAILDDRKSQMRLLHSLVTASRIAPDGSSFQRWNAQPHSQVVSP